MISMRFTCTKETDQDGKYHVKTNGIHIGNINEETQAGNTSAWVLRTKVVKVHNNGSGASPSLKREYCN